MAGLTPAETLVLIPAYEEEGNIGALVRSVRGRSYPVLVVDDGSADRTFEAASAAGAEVVRAARNGGKGAAIRLGLGRFLKGAWSAVIFMDADGQHDPSELDAFREALQDGADLVIGNRLGDSEGMPRVRRLTNLVMSKLLSALCGQPVADSQCGYRAARRRVLESVPLTTDRYEVESELIVKAARAGFRIRSIPVRCLYGGQKSQIRPLRDTGRFLSFLARNLF